MHCHKLIEMPFGGLTCNFMMRSTEYIPPNIMGKIYKLFCGMSKDKQRMLLSMSYAAKCWQENTVVLRAANFICYSPSYGQADEAAHLEHNITSIYLNSS